MLWCVYTYKCIYIVVCTLFKLEIWSECVGEFISMYVCVYTVRPDSGRHKGFQPTIDGLAVHGDNFYEC